MHTDVGRSWSKKKSRPIVRQSIDYYYYFLSVVRSKLCHNGFSFFNSIRRFISNLVLLGLNTVFQSAPDLLFGHVPQLTKVEK